MESTMKELRGGDSVLEPKSNVGGGVEDIYGEDRATEDQLITPWAFFIARLFFKTLDTVKAQVLDSNRVIFSAFWLYD